MKRLKSLILCSYIICVVIKPLAFVQGESVSAKEQVSDKYRININENVFSDISVRLNKEIYSISESVVNSEHFSACFNKDVSNTKLFTSYRRYMNPLVPIAMTVNECGSWADKRYTWSSTIYSKPMMRTGYLDLDYFKISEVNNDTYIILGLDKYLGCGSNCTAANTIGSRHTHISNGRNDNDSLGPLQILRRYIEAEGVITYDCGESTTDLLCWKDNVEYFFHKQSSTFAKKDHWNKNYEIKNVYELVALMGVAHNTGATFQVADNSNNTNVGSYWKNAGAIYDYCKLIGSESSVNVMQEYVDNWYNSVLLKIKDNEDFYLAGEIDWDSLEMVRLITNMNIEILNYVNMDSYGHKQVYPIKAVLNYMALEKLYNFTAEEVVT